VSVVTDSAAPRNSAGTGSAQHRGKMKPAKSILDPAFRYRPSHATDLRKTFEAVRQKLEQARAERAAAERVVPLKKAG